MRMSNVHHINMQMDHVSVTFFTAHISFFPCPIFQLSAHTRTVVEAYFFHPPHKALLESFVSSDLCLYFTHFYTAQKKRVCVLWQKECRIEINTVFV